MIRRLLTLGACMTALTLPAAETGLPTTGLPESLGIQSKSHNWTAEDLDAMGEAGFTLVRRGFYWNGIEPEAGRYDFSAYDDLLDRADAAGMRVLGCLFGNNALHEDDGRGGIQTEAGRRAFAAFAAALAERYRGRGIMWEVWNEPNVRTFWRKDGKHNSDEFAAEYTALVKAVVPAMLAVDPDCIVMAGSVSCFWQPSYDWTEACFKGGIAESGIAAWSVHPYGVKRPEDFTAGYTITREIMARYGADLPLTNTERGFALGKHFNADHAVQNEGWSGGPEELAREFQGWHLARQYLIDQMNDIRFTVWYEWSKKPGGKNDFGVIGDDQERPSLTALKTLRAQFDGTHYVRRLDVGSDLDFALLFEDGTGKRRLALWTAPPEGGQPHEYVAHDVTLPIALKDEPQAVDCHGRPAAVHGDGQSITLELTGMPIYLDATGADLSALE